MFSVATDAFSPTRAEDAPPEEPQKMLWRPHWFVRHERRARRGRVPLRVAVEGVLLGRRGGRAEYEVVAREHTLVGLSDGALGSRHLRSQLVLKLFFPQLHISEFSLP